MTNKKRILALVLAAALSVSAFAGCGEAKPEESNSSKVENADPNSEGEIKLNAPGEFPIVDGDPVTVSIFTAPHIDTYQLLSREDNTATAWFEDKVNMRIDWTIVTQADEKAKLNLLFQGGDYEDIIFRTFWDGATQYSYGKQGFLQPLNEYYENGDAYWWDLFKADVLETEGQFTQAHLDELVMPDGNIYSMVQGGTQAFHSGVANRMYMYMPWLEAVDMEVPTTTDEFYEVLKAFKEKDPNGNNKADEIPLTGALKGWNMDSKNFILNAFLYYDVNTKYYADNGEIKLTYQQDAFKEATKYMAKLYQEGLLDNEYFTQDNNTVKSKTTQEVQLVGTVAGGSWSAFTTATAGVEGDWTNYQTIAPLKGPEGVQYTKYYEPKPMVKAHITDNCETPKTAFRMLDTMYNLEVSMNLVAGYSEKDGPFYEILPEDTEVVAINGEKAKYRNINYGKIPNTAWSQIGPAPQAGAGWHSYQAIQDPDADPDLDLERLLYLAGEQYYPYIPEEGVIPPAFIFEENDANDVVTLKANLDKYTDEQFALMVSGQIGDISIDEYWDTYIAGTETQGASRLLELYQKAYDERMAVMNK